MTDSKLSPGRDVISFCSKCQLSLSHTVVVMKDAKIPHKVMCNTCKSTHVFKDINGSFASASKKTRKKKTPSQQIPIAEVWKSALASNDHTCKPYSLNERFVQGDIIEHPTFGKGIIESIIDNNKIHVLFQNDMKTLMHNQK